MNTTQTRVERSFDRGVLTLTLNRPEQFNALSQETIEALQGHLDAAATDEQLQCVVLGASGRAFCAGHDLKEMQAHRDHDYYLALFRQCSRLMQTIVEFPVPVIARVQGLATAAGCQLVASCDMAVAADTVRFAVSGINVGLFCSTPAVALSRNIEAKKAFEMLFTGEFIDAHDALRHGLVNRVVAADELDTAIDTLTTTLCAKSPVALRAGKAMFHRQRSMPLSEAYEFAAAIMARNMMTEDVLEGIDAFIGKRDPQWKGR